MGDNPSVEEQKTTGNYMLVDPLDYLLLQMLPDEGSIFAGLYPNGETVENMRTKFTPEQRKAITSSTISTRIRVMSLLGLVVSKHRGSNTRGRLVWQITPAGKDVLKKWKGAGNGNVG